MKNNDLTTTEVEEPVQVMMKNPKKVEHGKGLAELNCRKKGELAQAAETLENKPKLSQAYGIGVVITVAGLGLLGYYIYQSGSFSKKGDNIATKVNPD